MSYYLNNELKEAQQKYATSKEYYQKARASWNRQKRIARELLEHVEELEAQGNLKMAEEQEEQAAAQSAQANKIQETMEKAKEVANKDYERIEEVKGLIDKGAKQLPESEVQNYARQTALKESRKALSSRGISPNSPKGKKFEAAFVKKAYPGILKHYTSLNKLGNL